MIVEVCANSLQSALNAEKGGASRVELCDNLYEGGTTPGPGTIRLARKNLHIGLHVLIRPRGGDFLYSDSEFEVIKEDTLFCKDTGCDGVVIGFLNADGTVDAVKTAAVIALARPMSVTFHRAFDMTRDPFSSLAVLMELGVDRLLTSGQKNKAADGTTLIAALIKRAHGKIIIMPGSGINENNIAEIRAATGAEEFHLSGLMKTESKMEYRKAGIFLGGLQQIPEYSIKETDIEVVRRAVGKLNDKKI